MPTRPAPSRSVRAALAAAVCALVLPLLAIPAAADTLHCTPDAEGDVRSTTTDEVVASAVLDLQAACTAYEGDTVGLSARPAQVVDPATSPAFTQSGAQLVFELLVDRTDDGGQAPPPSFTVTLAAGGGSAFWQVFGPDGQRTCEPQEHVASGGRAYGVVLDVACLTGPDGTPPGTIRMGAFITAGDLFDELPPFDQRYDSRFVDGIPVAEFFGIRRLAGPDRVATAIAISRRLHPEPGTADAVVIASGGNANGPGQPPNSPDALSAGPLAVALGGPLLLTSGPQVTSAVLEEVQRVLAEDGVVRLVGGVNALSQAAEDAVRGLGVEVERIAGDTRYGTSLAVARAISEDPAVLVFGDGGSFEPALIGGTYAAARNAGPGGPGVMLLTQVVDGRSTVPAIYQPYLDDSAEAAAVAIGAEAAEAARASTPDRPDAPEPAPGTLVSVATGDPVRDAVAAAELLYSTPRQVVVASAADFPDGLAGTVLAGRQGVPLLLSSADVLSPAVQRYLAGLPRGIVDVFVLGGTAVLSEQVAEDASDCGVQQQPPASCTAIPVS